MEWLSEPFHPGYASRICNTWMALASFPAFQGQQRSFPMVIVAGN